MAKFGNEVVDVLDLADFGKLVGQWFHARSFSLASSIAVA